MHEKVTDVSLTKSNVSISTCSVKMLPVDQTCFIFYGSYCALSDGGMGGSHFKVNWHEKRLVRFSLVEFDWPVHKSGKTSTETE